MALPGRRTLAGDKGDELADALLHTLLCLLCDLGIIGQSILHDAGDWSKVANVSIKLINFVSLGGAARRLRRLGRIVRHGRPTMHGCRNGAQDEQITIR